MTGFKMNTHQQAKTSTAPTATAHIQGITLKITDEAFFKFKYMRDYRDKEVAMYGITKPEDPLYVTDFALVKQKVGAVSADIDPDGLADHVQKYLDMGIYPINCERVWCHTHPMTGESSANPSAKDMSTWNHEENSKKNLFVMMILSKSGQMTCRLRIRGNASKFVPGIDYPIDIDGTIGVKIVQTDSFQSKIKECAAKYFTTEALSGGIKPEYIASIVLDSVSAKEIIPEIADLENQYAELVSNEVFSTNSNYNLTLGTPFNSTHTSNSAQKKTAHAVYVPAIALDAGDNVESLKDIAVGSTQIISINDKWCDSERRTIITSDLKTLEDDFYSNHAASDDDICAVIIGSIRANVVTPYVDKFITSIYPVAPKDRAKVAVESGMFFPKYQRLAKIINGSP